MSLSLEKLKEILVTGGYIDEGNFDKAVAVASKKNEPLEIALVKNQVITDEKLGEAMAKYYAVPFFNLTEENLQNDLLEMLPEAVARAQSAVIFAKTTDGFSVATSTPDNFEFLRHLDQVLEGPIKIYYSTPLGMMEAFKAYKNNIFKKFAKKIYNYSGCI